MGPACGYNQVNTKLYGLPRNYLQVVNLNYYMPTEVQSGLGLQTLSNGDYDVVEALYSDKGLEYDSDSRDPYNITVGYDWSQ